MAKRDAIGNYMNATVAMPGLRDQVITRHDYFEACRAAGYDHTEANKVALAWSTPREGTPHPQARAICTALLTGDDHVWRAILYPMAVAA